ncbi:MAG: amidohydrolase family protein, partial [Bacteroidetes bacterium]|nr:amidohydrolase family protein [Bacteroidota bacterium]
MHKRIHILLFLSGTLFFPLCFLHAQIALKDFALTGVMLIDARHTKPSANQTVVVKNNMISDIFPDGSKILPDSVVAINLKGKYLIPGLIDTHVHMATDPSDVDNRATTLNVLSKMLYSGITSVRDMAGDARTLASYSRDAMTGDIIS